jgi:probable rRNA maturation factor
MSVSILNQQKKFKVDVSRVRRNLKRLLIKLNHKNSDICVVLVDDKKILEINRNYLQRNHPTNVISFAMTEGSFGDLHPEILGDIVISVETAARDAMTVQFDFMDELDFLIIHGLLHLLGYNHENCLNGEAEKMNNKERELFFMLRHYDLN